MSQKQITPRGKRILVLRDKEETLVSEFGIALPANTEREQKAFGTVEAVGKGIDDVKKGDRVLFGAFAGETVEQTVKCKKVEYKLLDDEDVIAYIKD